MFTSGFFSLKHEISVLQTDVIQLLHMMICSPSNYTFLILRARDGRGKTVVILKSPLHAGLIIVCLVFAMAVIETLAAGVYIWHVGRSRAPTGRVLIISSWRARLFFFCRSSSSFSRRLYTRCIYLAVQLQNDPLDRAIDFP